MSPCHILPTTHGSGLTWKPKWFLLLSLSTLPGCAELSTYDRSPLEPLLGETFIQSHAQSASDNDHFNHWWRQFQDPVIDQLVETALAHNYDLKIAAANVLEADALLRAAAGNRWPKLDVSASARRSFTPLSAIIPGNSQRVYNTTLQPVFSIAWQLDLWGRLRHAQQAALADWKASAADRQAVYHTVIADVIRQRVAQAIAQQRLTVAEQIAASRQRTLDTVERRYRSGVTNSSAVEVHLARANLSAAQSQLTALQLNADLAQHALAILSGLKPTVTVADTEAQPLPTLSTLEESITGIPAQLLDRRPDLMAAEFRTLAAQERISVAIADLYPDLVLNGRLGWSTNQPTRILSLDHLLGSIAGELATTLFQGGKLRADIDATKARLQAQAARYAQRVLQAMREVEDALARNRQLSQRLKQISTQLQQARLAESLSQSRYGRGISSLLTVLESERRRQEAEDIYLQVQQQLWNARIDLHLALGGDWLSAKPSPLISHKTL